MIPKIIHYFWMGSSMPADVQGYIDGWRKMLPDYEIRKWDYDRFPRGKSLWVDQAVDAGKYAFAADYLRLYALYTYGGIYLDTDVSVVKSLDFFLDLPYIVGQEKSLSGINTAFMGFPEHHPLLRQLLDRYDSRPFVMGNGEFDMEPNPRIIRKYIDSQMKYNVIGNKEDFVFDDNVFNVFTADYFSPMDYETREMKVTDKTYTIHHFAASWVSDMPAAKKIRGSFREKVVCSLMLRKNVVVVSNSMYELHFNRKFGLSSEGPLWDAYMSEDDFDELARLGADAFNRPVKFFDYRESRLFDKNDFHLVAKLDGTDIEIHFKNSITKGQALERWHKGVNEVNSGRVIFLHCPEKPSRKVDYLTCLLIDLGRTVIKW